MTRAPGEGSLYYDDTRGRWIGMASAGINPKTGKRRRVKITGKPDESKTSVAARLKDRIAELETGAGGPETVGELVTLWRKLEAPKRNSPSTLDGIDWIIKAHVLPVFGRVKVSTLTPDDVEAWLEARRHLSRSQLDKVRRVLKQSYDFALRRRYASWNPVAVSELPARLKPPRQGRALTYAETTALLNAAEHHRNGALVTVAVTLGLRVQEASALTWDYVDFERETLKVAQAFEWSAAGPRIKEPKTLTSARTVDMPPVTVGALLRHRTAWNAERLLMDSWPRQWASLVFVSSVGTPLYPSNLRRWLQQVADDAGIGKVSPRDLRTTAGSLLSAEGIALERISDLLGHRDIRTLQVHYRKPVSPSVDTALEYWRESSG